MLCHTFIIMYWLHAHEDLRGIDAAGSFKNVHLQNCDCDFLIIYYFLLVESFYLFYPNWYILYG